MFQSILLILPCGKRYSTKLCLHAKHSNHTIHEYNQLYTSRTREKQLSAVYSVIVLLQRTCRLKKCKIHNEIGWKIGTVSKFMGELLSSLITMKKQFLSSFYIFCLRGEGKRKNDLFMLHAFPKAACSIDSVDGSGVKG